MKSSLIDKYENVRMGFMRMIFKISSQLIYEIVLCLSIYATVILLTPLNQDVLAIILLLVGAITGFRIIAFQRGQLGSLTLVFWFFSNVYGLAAPIEYVCGLYEKPTFPSSLYDNYLNIHLLTFALASLAYMIGVLTAGRKCIDNESAVLKANRFIVSESFLVKTVLLCAFGAGLSEIINFLRVGGIPMLAFGKGVYQSAVGNLQWSMPAAYFWNMYCGLAGMLIGKFGLSNVSKTLSLSSMFVLPVLCIKSLLGGRGFLVNGIVPGILVYTLFCPIRRMSWKLILSCICAYLFLDVIATNRNNIGLLFSDFDSFWAIATEWDRYVAGLKPSNAEFGCFPGNFLVFYNRYGDSHNWLWGESYFWGIISIIPFLGRMLGRPQTILYNFRDEFFTDWALRSDIAGTGFSLILEAFWNFGYVGIFLVYFFIGFCLFSLEKRLANGLSWIKIIVLVAWGGIVVGWSRGLLSVMFTSVKAQILLFAIVGFVVIFVNQILFGNKCRHFK